MPLIYIILSSAAFFFGLTSLILISPQPPVKVIIQCQERLATARQEEAFRYAPEIYHLAELYWRKGFAEWRAQNETIVFQRSFVRTDSLMRAANNLAEQALAQSRARQDSLATFAETRLAYFDQRIAQVRSDIDRVFVRSLDRNKFARGELLILEGRSALQRKDYLTAVDNIKHGEVLVEQAGKAAKEKLENYLVDLPTWQQWARETLDWSRANNAQVIIVEKLLSRCLIYSAGELRREFRAEFGPEWIGHKQQKGDGTTPEGQYFITKKKNSHDTQYYKALEINYPNDSDRMRFDAAKRNGLIPPDAQIGGLIEIHGEGGKGVNWTKGCVALRNSDMDSLFELADVGTPVTIVGKMQAH